MTLIASTDCCEGAMSVGARALQARWCGTFDHHRAVDLEDVDGLGFRHKASWAGWTFWVRLYMQPTPAEAADGVTEKRVVWPFLTSTAWTTETLALADGSWDWREANGLWVSEGHSTELTEMVKIEWFYCTYFGVAVGDEMLIDGLRLTTTDTGTPPRPAATLAVPAPNPFNPGVELRFRSDEARRLRLSVYDAAGRRVRILAEGVFGPGEVVRRWDGRDAVGRCCASGAYVARLEGNGIAQTRKLTLAR